MEALNDLVLQNAWIMAGTTVFLSLHTIIKAIRDAIDKTPQTDDNLFEKIVTITGKVAGYLMGIRPKVK